MNSTGQEKKILLVEDEVELGQLLLSRLERSGYAVCATGTGAEGLGKLRELKPDLVILDLTLPDMMGNQVCELIRKDPDPQIADIPVLILSGKAPDVVEEICRSCQATSYVIKPYNPANLINEINRCISLK